MSKSKSITITKAEASYLLDLCESNQDSGRYWGNAAHFMKRQLVCIAKLRGLFEEDKVVDNGS